MPTKKIIFRGLDLNDDNDFTFIINDTIHIILKEFIKSVDMMSIDGLREKESYALGRIAHSQEDREMLKNELGEEFLLRFVNYIKQQVNEILLKINFRDAQDMQDLRLNCMRSDVT